MEPSDHNRRAFDEAHRTSENVLATPGIPDPIRERLHGVGGSRVLHLLCGTGRESIELAELGALVTGVDDDEAAIDAARRGIRTSRGCTPTCTRCRPSCCSAAGTSSTSARARWTASTRSQPWAAGVAAALRPGGVLLLHDEHPAAACLDAFGRWRGDYFASTGVGELVDAVTGAGLVLRGLEEWPGKDARVPSHLVLAAENPDA